MRTKILIRIYIKIKREGFVVIWWFENLTWRVSERHHRIGISSSLSSFGGQGTASAALEPHFGIVSDDDGLLAKQQCQARDHEEHGRQQGGYHELLVRRFQIEPGHYHVAPVRVETGETSSRVVVGAVFAVVFQEVLAFVLQGVYAAFQVDHQTTLVGHDQFALQRCYCPHGMGSECVQVTEIGEVGQVCQNVAV